MESTHRAAGEAEAPWKDVRPLGLTPATAEIRRLRHTLPRKAAVYAYRRKQALAWIAFIGGTGTGKSTLFNALCGERLSDTGVERPKTFGPLLYAHQSSSLQDGFPLPWGCEAHQADGRAFCPYAGSAGHLLLLQHHREDLAHLVLVDTPDVDSVELKNRQAVEDIYLLADIVVFVTSQEKYADEVPFQFLQRVVRKGKPVFIVLNKVEDGPTAGEVSESFRTHGIRVPDDRFTVIPYLPGASGEVLAGNPAFRQFSRRLLEAAAPPALPRLLSRGREQRAHDLSEGIERLLHLLGEEEKAAAKWVTRLDMYTQAACSVLFQTQEQRFADETREYIQREIRHQFSRYDLLRKPRRLISQIILTPLRMMGFSGPRAQETHEDALQRIRRRFDVTPIVAAIENLNRSVLEKLSPEDESSPLHAALRDPELILSEEKVRTMVWQEQDRLLSWLEGSFQELANGIPKSKQWGIYSTSILWGGLILSLETAIGGGISVLEAVLDTAIAPFVTMGAVELFAYREIQKIGRELGARYRAGLEAIVRQQRDRYEETLRGFMVGSDTMDSLRTIRSSLLAEAGPVES